MAKLRALDFRSAPFAARYYDSDPAGSPDNAMLLLHGTFGSTASHFGLIFPLLATDRRVIGLDFQVGDELTVQQLSAQVRALIDGLSLSHVQLVGYSLGAVVAAAVAADHPHCVKNLVLIAGWAATDAHQQLRNRLWFHLRDTDEKALRQFIALSVFSPEFLARMSPAQLKATLGSVRLSPAGDAHMRLNREVDIREKLVRVEAETLVLSCTQDAMVPPHHQHELTELIPDAHREFLHGGHGIVFEDPDAVAQAIRNFVD